MQVDRFTWVGLSVVGLGWAALIADMTLSESMLRAGNLVAVISLRSDIVTIAQTAIISGFGLTLLGALRSGFGALIGSFGSGAPRTPMSKVVGVSFDDDELPELQMPMSQGPNVGATPGAFAPDRTAAVSQIRPVPSAYLAMSERPVSSGQIKDRNYVILSDGSVEVETLLGTRIFASLDEARDFIR